MKRIITLLLATLLVGFGFSSCAEDPGNNTAGPVSNTGKNPWNIQPPNHGQGQLGMMPQNQYRR